MNSIESLFSPVNEETVEDTKVTTTEEQEEQETTTEDVVEEQEEVEDSSIYDEISDITGFRVEGTFEDSVEGYAEYSKALYQHSRESLMQEIAEQHPQAYEALMYTIQGGDPRELYQATVDTIADVDNEIDAEGIVVQGLVSKGIDESTAKFIAEKHKDDGRLVEEANKIIADVNKSNETNRAEMIAKQEQFKREQDELINKTASGLKNIITKGIFEENGVKTVIPDADKQGFIDYMMNSVQVMPDGSAVVVHKIDNIADLKYDYFRFKRGNLDGLVNRRANDLNAKKLRRSSEPSNNKQTISNSIESLF